MCVFQSNFLPGIKLYKYWNARAEPCLQAPGPTIRAPRACKLKLAVDYSLVPRLSWNANMHPRLHNFNVRIPERGSLGTRLCLLRNRKHWPRSQAGLETRLHDHIDIVYDQTREKMDSIYLEKVRKQHSR